MEAYQILDIILLKLHGVIIIWIIIYIVLAIQLTLPIILVNPELCFKSLLVYLIRCGLLPEAVISRIF